MTEQTQPPVLAESLSALMDNEASELELQRLLKALESEPELKSTWSRYQIASAGVKGDIPVLASSDFASRVSAAIEAEETYSAPVIHQVAANQTSIPANNVVAMPLRWWQQAGRVAVAASVAGAVILGVQQYQTPGLNPTDMAAGTMAAETGSGSSRNRQQRQQRKAAAATVAEEGSGNEAVAGTSAVAAGAAAAKTGNGSNSGRGRPQQ